MLFILISWLYILTIALLVGIAVNSLLKLKNNNSATTVLLGFFGITLFTGFWAVFFRINWEFHIVLLILSILMFYLNKARVFQCLKVFNDEFRNVSKFFKVIFISIVILVLAQCASPPFLLDNESYYIQTIKWLNEYGFVKGLVNLHLFLGQTSGWHILQSAFSFSLLYENFNDLSGLCLLLGNYYAIVKLDGFIKDNSNISYLIIGLFPVFNVLLFQFISAPSPDIAVYVIGLVVFHLFIDCYRKYNKTSFLTLSILTLFMVFIKLSAIVFCILPLVLLVKHFQESKKAVSPILLVGGLSLCLFIVKNIILTGNAIYPLASVEGLSTSWHLPKTIESYFIEYGRAYGYNVTTEVFQNTSAFTLLKNWMLQFNIHGLFNSLMIMLLIISPLFIIKSKLKKSFKIIYGVALLNMIFLFINSPQYRFFISFIIILSLFILSTIINRCKIIKMAICFALIVTAIPLCYPLNVSGLTNTETHKKVSHFSFENIIRPHGNSKYSKSYNTIQLQNTSINTPTDIDFFWGTGDITLPALNVQQLNYFRMYFNVIPQQYSEDLKDGFYSKALKND